MSYIKYIKTSKSRDDDIWFFLLNRPVEHRWWVVSEASFWPIADLPSGVKLKLALDVVLDPESSAGWPMAHARASGSTCTEFFRVVGNRFYFTRRGFRAPTTRTTKTTQSTATGGPRWCLSVPLLFPSPHLGWHHSIDVYRLRAPVTIERWTLVPGLLGMDFAQGRWMGSRRCIIEHGVIFHSPPRWSHEIFSWSHRK